MKILGFRVPVKLGIWTEMSGPKLCRRWLQLVGCATLLMDASDFGGPDGVGESRVEPRRSLRRRERVKEK